MESTELTPTAPFLAPLSSKLTRGWDAVGGLGHNPSKCLCSLTQANNFLLCYSLSPFGDRKHYQTIQIRGTGSQREELAVTALTW